MGVFKTVSISPKKIYKRAVHDQIAEDKIEEAIKPETERLLEMQRTHYSPLNSQIKGEGSVGSRIKNSLQTLMSSKKGSIMLKNAQNHLRSFSTVAKSEAKTTFKKKHKSVFVSSNTIS